MKNRIILLISMFIMAFPKFSESQEVPPEQPPLVVISDAIAIARGSLLDELQVKQLTNLARQNDDEAAFRLSQHFKSKGDEFWSSYWQLLAAVNSNSKAQYSEWFDKNQSSDCATMGRGLVWLEMASKNDSQMAKDKLVEFKERIKDCMHLDTFP